MGDPGTVGGSPDAMDRAAAAFRGAAGTRVGSVASALREAGS